MNGTRPTKVDPGGKSRNKKEKSKEKNITATFNPGLMALPGESPSDLPPWLSLLSLSLSRTMSNHASLVIRAAGIIGHNGVLTRSEVCTLLEGPMQGEPP